MALEFIGLRNLCKPAMLYLTISVIAFVIMAIQNIGSRNVYCLGTYRCDMTNTTFIFVAKAIYIAFWTWIINIMCRKGYTNVAWVFTLLPFIGSAIACAMIFAR